MYGDDDVVVPKSLEHRRSGARAKKNGVEILVPTQKYLIPVQIE